MKEQPSQNARRLRQKLRSLIADKNTMPIDKKVYKAKLDQLEKGQLTEKLISAELGQIERDAENDPLRAGNPGGKVAKMNTIKKLQECGVHIAAVMEGGHAVVSAESKLPKGIKVVGTFGTSHVIVK